MDGPTFATYMRDQLESELRENGELPLNLSIDVARHFRDVTGDGEIWIDGRGYPLRLMVHLVYPEARDGSHVEADITTDLSGFPDRLAAAPQNTDDPVAWAGTLVSKSASNNPQSARQSKPGTRLARLLAAWA